MFVVMVRVEHQVLNWRLLELPSISNVVYFLVKNFIYSRSEGELLVSIEVEWVKCTNDAVIAYKI